MTSRAWRRRSGRSTRSAEGGASTVATAMPSTTASRSTPPSPQSWATACGGSPTAGARDIGPSRRPAASRPGSISSTARWCIPSARRAGHVVGKPEEGKLHVRFAEGALETGLRAGMNYPAASCGVSKPQPSETLKPRNIIKRSKLRGIGPPEIEAPAGGDSRRQQPLPGPTATAPVLYSTGVRLPLPGRRRAVVPGAPQEAEAMQPSSGPGEDPPAAVQPFSPRHATALHVSGLRVLLEARSAGRAACQAAHGAQEAPSRMPTDHGMDHATPAPAGAGLLPAAECAVARPLQLRRCAGQLRLAAPLLHMGHAVYVQMAQAARRQAEELHLGAVYPAPRPGKDSTSSHHRGQTSESVRLKAPLCTAEASPTEEPDAGKPHVRDCTGGAGQPAFLP
jgi:hypothetical protein